MRTTTGLLLVTWITLSTAPSATAQTRAQFDQMRRQMVQEAIVGAGVSDERVVKAMLATPRHEFVEASLRPKAYLDMSLPIGDSQTISSPFIVAYMTETLDPQPTDKVLEIGTGSGYQAAVLSPLVKDVYTIEIVDSLGQRAARTLKRLGYDNVHAKVGDGFLGWPENSPFDKIIVTCSPEKVPKPLVDQLREGGLMVIPVGERYQQTLYLLRKKDGKLEFEKLQPTLFVPMTGRAEDQRERQPDPLNPSLINGGFEAPAGKEGYIPSWYYQRQVELTTDNLAPDGKQYITFHNDDRGRPSHLLQGFPVDGRKVHALVVSARVRYRNIRRGDHRDELPMMAVSFFDEQRRDLGAAYIGPFTGDQPWHNVTQTMRVPADAREAIFRMGLFGATGEISFDSISLSPARN